MSDVKIQLRDNGPILVQGPVTVIDSQGNTYPIPSDKPAVSLCRCGASSNSPFCDGAHRDCGFEAADRAPVE